MKLRICWIFLWLLLGLFLVACQEQEAITTNNNYNNYSNEQQLTENIAADAMRGMRLAEAHCSSCHYLDSTRSKVGPGLKGVFDQPPRIKGIPYAVWDAAALDAWIANPNKVKPRTRMGILGIKQAADRADIIAWMQQNN